MSKHLARLSVLPKFVHARSTVGAVLFAQGHSREARGVFFSLLPLAEELGDPATVAGISGKIADCELRLGELDAAND